MDALILRYAKVSDRVRDKRTAGVLLRHSELAWNEADRRMSWTYKFGITPLTNRTAVRVDVVRRVQQALDRAALSEGTPLT
jgi:hypothetical protein